MSYVDRYLTEASEILQGLDAAAVERLVGLLADVQTGRGRLFVLGVGGGAGHASHAVADFRKLTGIEAYSPADNISELTARINDEGWKTAYGNWLEVSHLGPGDMVLVFSVGGGDLERNVSANLVFALEYAKNVGATVCGVVGRDGGFTAKVADACVIVPTVNSDTVTAHTESFQALVWHLLVSHPKLRRTRMRWESLTVPEQT